MIKELSRNKTENRLPWNWNCYCIRDTTTGDYNLLRDLEFKIIYNSMFYIPFRREKIGKKEGKIISIFRLSKKSPQYYVSSFCWSSVFLSDYIGKPSTGECTKTEQINNRTAFGCLRKLVCIAGGFKQTVPPSSNIQFHLQDKNMQGRLYFLC